MNDILKEIVKFNTRHTATKLILFYFDKIKIKGFEATYQDIAKTLGIGRASVIRAVDQLESMKIIWVVRRQLEHDMKAPNLYWWFDERRIGQPKDTMILSAKNSQINVEEV